MTSRDPNHIYKEYHFYRGYKITILYIKNKIFSSEWIITRGKGIWRDPSFSWDNNRCLISAKEEIKYIIDRHGKYHSTSSRWNWRIRYNDPKIEFRHDKYDK